MSAYDTRSALWLSHSSISEYLQCPRAYYLHYVYKDPETKHKITLMSPPLALGQVVHDVMDELSSIPTSERFRVPLTTRFEQVWSQVTGKRGGFRDQDEEEHYKDRGRAMMQTVTTHPGPIAELAVKIKMDLPHYWLSEPDGIILCGRIDWLVYHPDTDSVSIVDFKTSMREEKVDSLQLPIYYLLTQACQKRPITGASYWYLENQKALSHQPLPDAIEARERILTIGKEMQISRKIGRLRCRQGTGCRACKPFEAIVNHEAEFVYSNNRNQDVYIQNPASSATADMSEIL
jgi:CRISPR/Cas system-associated exonuclease Cas4 (RecB family)